MAKSIDRRFTTTTSVNGATNKRKPSIKRASGGATSGMGYTATKTNRATGKKTTITGTLTPTTESEFKGTGKMMERRSKRIKPSTSARGAGGSAVTRKKRY